MLSTICGQISDATPLLPLVLVDKWAKLSMRVLSNTQTSPSQSIVQSCANSYSGYGAVMFFNLRDYDCSSFMNYFASRVWGTGKTVCRTSTIYPKNY